MNFDATLKRLLGAAVIAGAVAGSAVSLSAQDAERKPDAAHGKEVYMENCAACHNSLKKVCPALVEDVGYFIRAGVPPQAMGALLRKPVRERPPGSRMPSFTPAEISDADLDDMGLYLAGFTPVPARPPRLGVASRGAARYGESCAPCHGANGEGVGEILPLAHFANGLKQGGAPPAVILGFVHLATRSGSVPNMPTFTPSQLSDRDLADISAHIWAMQVPQAPAEGAPAAPAGGAAPIT